MKKLFFIAATMLFVLSSCKKDCPAPVVEYNLGGTTYKGTATAGAVNYDPFTIVFSANGTCTVTFQGFSPFPGTWNKAAGTQTVYIFFTESSTNTWKGQGTLSVANDKIESGTLTRLTPSAVSGTFTTTKQ